MNRGCQNTTQDGSLIHRYESLRVSRAASLERNLFMRCGMVVWMETWSDYSVFSDTAECDEPYCDVSGDEPLGNSQELQGVSRVQTTEILGQIAWAVLRGVMS
ncbi:MAG: hypothetical protein KAX15_07180 [Candidatus Omnitrophica bacterium]|nr:hypothetical protein [Candidatus Omnitrophota bacterium]